jgi:peptidoglycan-associated lipoprotein
MNDQDRNHHGLLERARKVGSVDRMVGKRVKASGKCSCFCRRSNPLDRRNRILVPVVLFFALIAVGGCKKKATPPPAPTAPPVVAPAPTAKITASPTMVTAGDQVVLSWSTTNATTVSIDSLGDVPTSGVRTVTPAVSTSYHLLAKGAGGSADASVRITVNAPPTVAAPVNTMSDEEEFKANVHDIFFNYDKYDLRADAQATLSNDTSYLLSHPNVKVLIGGYCDERGSNEYNIALGQNRAESAKKGLVNAGVAASRIRVISYGKEKPFCTESTESCWQQNRRAGFSLDR